MTFHRQPRSKQAARDTRQQQKTDRQTNKQTNRQAWACLLSCATSGVGLADSYAECPEQRRSLLRAVSVAHSRSRRRCVRRSSRSRWAGCRRCARGSSSSRRSRAESAAAARVPPSRSTYLALTLTSPSLSHKNIEHFFEHLEHLECSHQPTERKKEDKCSKTDKPKRGMGEEDRSSTAHPGPGTWSTWSAVGTAHPGPGS